MIDIKAVNLTTYTFRMADAYKDDYVLNVDATTRSEAESIANRVDDDAVVACLLYQTVKESK